MLFKLAESKGYSRQWNAILGVTAGEARVPVQTEFPAKFTGVIGRPGRVIPGAVILRTI
jgi:hypothetical protein